MTEKGRNCKDWKEIENTPPIELEKMGDAMKLYKIPRLEDVTN